MADRAAIVTGASSGIGLAVAEMLGEEGYALTVAARRPEKLEQAAQGLRDKGCEVQAVAGALGEEEGVKAVVAAHRAQLPPGRLCCRSSRRCSSRSACGRSPRDDAIAPRSSVA